MICILQKHVGPAGLLSELCFFFPDETYFGCFILLLLRAPFHTLTPVSHAEQTDW